MSKNLKRCIEEAISKKKKLLSVFLTAGFPTIQDTEEIILSLDHAGVDFIELGIPFSDPIADGPVIQAASDRALSNGINLTKIFEIVQKIRKNSNIPIILMGYLNPIYIYDIERAIDDSQRTEVDGWIIPDWPIEENQKYSQYMLESGIDLIYLIAPNTPPERILKIDAISSAFVYCVAYTGVTGKDNKPTRDTIAFFSGLREKIKSPLMIGFGIKNREDYMTYTQYGDGVIVGSAFIKLLESTPRKDYVKNIVKFVKHLQGEQ
jgi:tryptophan synthase alpha chain